MIHQEELNRRRLTLIFEIVSSLILLSIIYQESNFYMTYFVLMIEKTIQLLYDKTHHICFFKICQEIVFWLCVISCAFSFCLILPSFEEYLYHLVCREIVKGALLVALLSYILKETAETIYKSYKATKQDSEIEECRRKEQ